jgi:voltage-gated potassium channel
LVLVRLTQSRAMPWRWDPILRRSSILLTGVMIAGTAGIHWIEGWSVWHSFFFTLITLTTVGYTEYGLSEAGERFAAVIMLGGIATASYCLAQIVEFFTVRAMHPERKTMQQIRRLSGHHIVCGAGSMGQRVIERLEAQGAVAVAIDPDPAIVERLRDRGLIVLRGDATSDSVLRDAGIGKAGSLAAVTSSDAVNAMICLTAHALAPDVSIVARSGERASETKLRRAGASAVISPTIYGGDGIAEFMARPDVARIMFGDHATETAVSNPMRIVEIRIEAGDPAAGGTLGAFAEAHPTLTVVACRAEQGAFEMKPGDEREIRVGDSVMVAGMVADLGSLARAAA